MKRVLILLGLALVGGGVLVGCGSGGKGPSVATVNGGTPSATARPTPTASQDRQQQMVDFARCMRAHGVNMPDPDPGGGIKLQVPQGTSKEKLQAAQEACKQYLPGGGTPPSLSPEQLQDLQRFAKCMRDHGIDIPDPDPGNPGIRFRNVDPNDPKFKAAQQACQGQLPGNLRIGTGGGGG